MYVFKVILIILWTTHLSFGSFQKQLLTTYDFKVAENFSKNKKDHIIEISLEKMKLPSGVRFYVASFYTFTLDFKTRELCLIIETPRSSSEGKLILLEKEKQEKSTCLDNLFKEKVLVERLFYNATILFADSEVAVNLDKEKLTLNLFNKKKLKSTLFSPHIPENQFGSTLLAIGPPGESIEKIPDGSVCFDVDDQCKIIKSKCSKCKGGSYYVKKSRCTKYYSRVCGINTCGGADDYACLKGISSLVGRSDRYCVQDSSYAFCQDKNLRVACYKGNLICK